jgi:hypothetical protein
MRVFPIRHTHVGRAPKSLLGAEICLGDCPVFLFYSPLHIPFRNDGGR